MEEQIILQSENLVVGTVYSVNGKDGNVVLTTSDLDNTSDYQTGADVTQEITKATDSLQSQISALASGAPTPVSSTADMTDTTKTYLLTTDGYWYYYDGSNWVRGGVYQSTGLADFSVTPVKTTFSKRSSNLIDLPNAHVLNGYPANDGMHTSAQTRCLWIECEPNTTYTISRSVNSGRFAAATFETQPSISPLSTDILQNVTYNTSYYFTITTDADANYLVVYYWNELQSPNTADDALVDLCIVKGTSDGEVIPSYIINVGTDNLEDGCVTPEKTSFTKNTANLFDKSNANVIQGNPSISTNTIAPSSLTRSIYIPCEGNKNYVIKKVVTARYSVATTSVTPVGGAACLQIVYNDTAQQLKIKTNSSANYLVVYLYNSNYDTATLEDILNTLVIVEGTEDIDEYIPYGKIIRVQTDNIDDKAVTPEKLSDEVMDSISLSGSLASRNGIYGVQYDITATSSACTRIGNAVGLNNDYVVESTYQLNGGVNDFDNIFPWSDIRRCNVTVDSNGQKTITYEGETGFALDGTNGNVMVEIPKFYSMRERIGNIEKLCITGEPKSGFTVEPAFVVDGVEQDFVYVACYHKSEALNGVWSYSGSYPLTYRSLDENIDDLETSNLQSYDITMFLMLQKLMIVEFANRSLQQFMGGMGRLPFWYANSSNAIDGFGTNYITFQDNVGDGTLNALWVGERIRVGDAAGGTYSMKNVRVITAITKNGTQWKVEYAGDDLSGELAIGDGVGACPQKNGWCDSLSYHTGRRNFASTSSIANFVNPMRYRYIENVIGNVWEQLAGIRVKNLVVHYNFEPNFNKSFANSDYKTLEYQVPAQTQYPLTNQGYIIKEGYNVNNRLFNLPVQCGTAGGMGKYAGGTFYSSSDPTKECEAVVCGGWDTSWWANINTFRCWEYAGIRSGLYGNRAIYRG